MRRRLAALTLLLVALLPAAVWAGYRIGVAGEFIETASYWIAGDRLYLGAEDKSVELARVESIEITPDSPIDEPQRVISRASLKAEFKALDEGELKLEELLIDSERIVKYLAALAMIDQRTGRVGDAKSDARRNLELADKLNVALRQRLGEVRLPGRDFLPLRDVRQLRLGSLALVINDYRQFLKSGDGVYLKYAEEHRRQAEAFRQSYLELSGRLD